MRLLSAASLPETDESVSAELRGQSWRFLSLLLELDSLLFSLPAAVAAGILGFEPMAAAVSGDLRRSWWREYGVTGMALWAYISRGGVDCGGNYQNAIFYFC